MCNCETMSYQCARCGEHLCERGQPPVYDLEDVPGPTCPACVRRVAGLGECKE